MLFGFVVTLQPQAGLKRSKSHITSLSLLPTQLLVLIVWLIDGTDS